MYGSTREYSDLPDEYDDLNLGIVSLYRSYLFVRALESELIRRYEKRFSPLAVVFVKHTYFFLSWGRVGPALEKPDGVSCEKDKVLS